MTARGPKGDARIGLRIVRHSRYVVFQLADMGCPAPATEMLRRIDGLRLRPLPT
jgi:hypothetical protein